MNFASAILWQASLLPTVKPTRRKDAGFNPPPTRALACADEIRRRILEGHYAGGMQLRQDALAEEFGVSRIPVREALVQLEAEGLVRIQPHKGAVVSDLSSDDILELFEFRALIEPRLLERSAGKLTEEEFGQLDGILEAYSEELRSLQIGRWGTLNTQFHTLLYTHAEAPRIVATAQQLLQSSDRFTRMQIYYTDGRQRAEHEHSRIVQLSRKGDIAGAAETLRLHILKAGDDLSKHLAERKRQGR